VAPDPVGTRIVAWREARGPSADGPTRCGTCSRLRWRRVTAPLARVTAPPDDGDRNEGTLSRVDARL